MEGGRGVFKQEHQHDSSINNKFEDKYEKWKPYFSTVRYQS